ncbi:hypothetical protein CSA37_08830 [Candidatus Fermentibacteria bacterium]|nr:MAG: hypothetical protein CSA37_08830 [Candidatus Fermentibacteria bacterium]
MYSQANSSTAVKVFPVMVFCSLLFASCLHEPESVPEPQVDISPFVSVWERVEQNYPLIAKKEINWMEIGETYYNSASVCKTDAELFELIVDMIEELEDPALFLISSAGDTIRPYTREFESNVDMTVLIENYLEPNGYQGNTEGFGWCDPSVLPYACFSYLPSENDSITMAIFDDFIRQCDSLELSEIIIDIRMNPFSAHRVGGSAMPWYPFDVMSRFVDRMKTAAIYRIRAGLEYNAYHDWHPTIRPAGENQYTGTVYLLVGGACTQAAEEMAVNMESLTNVVLVGDTTAGSNTAVFINDYPSSEGPWGVATGFCTLLTHSRNWVEGAGFPPDIPVEATVEDFAAGVDPVMEYAMSLLAR